MEKVSVIVTTYNPKEEDILATLRSVVRQKDIRIQLLIADDGSQICYWAEIRKLMETESFSDYTLIKNKENRGIVQNVCSALKLADGEYVKCLGQGDLFYRDDVLSRIVSFMKEKNSTLSFGKLVSFQKEGDAYRRVEHLNPLNIKPYLEENHKRMVWQYLLYLNGPCGASTIYRTDRMRTYMYRFRDRVIYCEDNIFAFYLLDHEKIAYFPSYFVWYAYGDGMSTSSDEVWKQRMKKDQLETFLLIARHYHTLFTTYVYRIYQANSAIRSEPLRLMTKILLNPDCLINKLRNRLAYRETLRENTKEPVDFTFIRESFGMPER